MAGLGLRTRQQVKGSRQGAADCSPGPAPASVGAAGRPEMPPSGRAHSVASRSPQKGSVVPPTPQQHNQKKR